MAVGNDPEAIAAYMEAQEIHADGAPFFWSVVVPPPGIFRDNLKGYAHRMDQTLPYHRLRFTR